MPTDPLWRLIVQLLPSRDPDTEWYTVAELAPLVGVKPRALLHHARQLWPGWEGRYRLNHEQAVRLVRRACAAGRKLPSRESLETRIADATTEGGTHHGK